VEQSNKSPISGQLRKKTLRSSAFELGGYGAQQILRLGSNLVLTRLLFPAAFGLSSTVSIVIFGMTMLSDLGIQQFIIQSPRGDDPEYLDTAFTFQAIRGLVLGVIMIALAYPAAWFFKEPGLIPLIMVGSIQLFAGGLRSTSLFTLRRRLTIGWVSTLELGQALVTYAIMIPWAIMNPSPFPLVAGGSIAACVHSLATHALPVGHRNRFFWKREVYSEIRLFGRWIFGSSVVTFLGAQIGRILYGKFLGMAWLGVYSVAMNLSDAVSAVINRMIGGVLFPLFSQATRDDNTGIADVYYSLRLRIDLFVMSGLGLLAGAGGWIVQSLWDERYADAAWILRILCFKVALATVLSLGEALVFSFGYTRYGFWNSGWRFLTTMVAMPLGWLLGGVPGVIWSSVLAEVPPYLVTWRRMKRMKILRIERELLAFALFLAAFALGAVILQFLPNIHVRG
jgi:O-antigen/teichoic acid export membrane protein